MAVQTGGFNFAPGSVATGMESRLLAGAGNQAPLRFVDGASLVARSGVENWLAGSMEGSRALAAGIAKGADSVADGFALSNAKRTQREQFEENVDLKRLDQGIRERQIEAGLIQTPGDVAGTRLLNARADLLNGGAASAWNPTAASGLNDVTPEDLPQDGGFGPDGADATQDEIIGTGQPGAGSLNGEAQPLDQWTDEGGGLFSKIIYGPDNQPAQQILAIPDPRNPASPKVVSRTSLAAAAAKSKGTPLLQDQMKSVANVKSAEYTLGEIEKKLDLIEARGPIVGTARAMNPYDVEAQSLENMVNSLVPGLARGVFGEVGVLTDKDMERYKRMIPNIKADSAVARQIVTELRDKLHNSLKSNLDVWDAAGYNVGELRKQFGTPSKAEVPVISSQAEYDALPVGAKYKTSAGKDGVKKAAPKP